MIVETIAIIGGGIGGLASAILLSKQGYTVTIYEKTESPSPVGAGFLLQPPGQYVLNKLGVLPDIQKHAQTIMGLQSQTVTGRQLLNLEYKDLKGKPRHGLGVQRSVIYNSLLQALLRADQVNFVWDCQVQQCINYNNKVKVLTDVETKEYDLCILSSGANSHLANEHFKNRISKPYGWGCLWTTFDLPATLAPNILHQRCKNTTKMMGILPLSKKHNKYEAALYWSMKSQDLMDINEGKFAAIKSEIMDFWPQARGSIEDLEYTDFIPANYKDVWTPKPFTGRLIIIGDISHATSPQLGQGCTMALLDALSLSSHLKNPLNNLETSLEQWWRSRRYQLAYVRYLSKWLTPLFQSESKLCEVFRDHIMAPVGRLPVFDTMQLKTLASEVFLNATDKDGNF